MRMARSLHSHLSELLLLFYLVWGANYVTATNIPVTEDNLAEAGTTLANASRSAAVPELTVRTSSLFDELRNWAQLPELDRWIHGVSLPVKNPTKSFWLDTPGANPLAQVGSTGELTEDADVCIIGSGITGVSAAWHLSNTPEGEEKPSVVILEAREFCSGATGRNGGHLVRNVFNSFISRQASHNTSEAIKTYLLEKYTAETLVNFIKDRSLNDTVDLVEGGHITLFRTHNDEKQARADYEAAKDAGLEAGSDMGVRWIGNAELKKEYGLSSDLNYTGVWFPGHNLWPCKLVTELFQDSQNVALHTKTPVTSILPSCPTAREDTNTGTNAQAPLSFGGKRRRWTVGTPRGSVQCSYVVHATNAYAGYLLPFLSDTIPARRPTCPHTEARTVTFDSSALPQPTLLAPGTALPPLPPIPRHDAAPRRNAIVPTRGQVGAVRASVDAARLGWLNAWDGGGGGWEYWFPRYQDTNRSAGAEEDASGARNPLIILGGGRQFSGGTLEAGVADDSVLNPRVSKALWAFLPSLFPGAFEDTGGREWEMEWTGIMGFTKTGEPFVGPVASLIEDTELFSRADYSDGQYIAAGYSGHGMPRAYACAEAVAGMIKAEMRGEEWAIPEWLPESYLTTAKK